MEALGDFFTPVLNVVCAPTYLKGLFHGFLAAGALACIVSILSRSK